VLVQPRLGFPTHEKNNVKLERSPWTWEFPVQWRGLAGGPEASRCGDCGGKEWGAGQPVALSHMCG
jgi:hypothetical protein